MQRIIFHLEEKQIAFLNRLVAGAEYGTDRSKALRSILDNYFREAYPDEY